MTRLRGTDSLEATPQHEIPRLESAHPALAEIFPHAQAVRVTNQKLGGDTGDERDVQSESVQCYK